MSLILPSNPLFWEMLHCCVPPGWQDYNRVEGERALVVDSNNGLLRPANRKELFEYIYGGEYDLVEPDDDEFVIG
jgi:hypothetical protein